MSDSTPKVVRVERSIPAASSDVWAVLADLPNHASWRSDVKVSRMLGEPTSGVGARRHLDLAPVGGLDETVLDWEEGCKMVVAVDKATAGDATLRTATARARRRSREPAGAGSQGERWFNWAWLQLPVGDHPTVAHWLLVRRSLTRPTELAYYRACGPGETLIAELIRVAGMRWAIEVGFEDAKGVVGLHHDEGRTWTPWHRHIPLALLAHAALAVTRRTAQTMQKGGPPI